MPTSIIIGSGPAAAGAALALVNDPAQQVTIIDIGGRLEPEHEQLRVAAARKDEQDWRADDLATISHQPVSSDGNSLPEKRTYGSDFPFRDAGQLVGVHSVGEANRSVVSGAYGGFSNVWGAQIMPFSAATFERWPISRVEMEPHYQVALGEMTLTGEHDDLDALFPLLVDARPLPELADRTKRVIQGYERHRGYIQSLGITVGRARLALRSEGCTRCGLCMTGCPYQLIYSAAHSLDRLRADGRIQYRSGLLALDVVETAAIPSVRVKDLSSGRIERLSADRIYVACGGIGTTRLIMGSIGHFDQTIELGESVQFVMPAVSVKPVGDPRTQRNFTLNQFNMVYDATGEGFDLCQIHFYPFNPVFERSLPALLQRPSLQAGRTSLLRRLSVGLGYLPSWASPKIRVTAQPASIGSLPELTIDREAISGWPPMFRTMATTMVRTAPSLDLWPVLPATILSAAGKSYHFGGSFPHGDHRNGLTTDRQGRLDRWDNIHLIDASVFPNVPATTFTLTIMANAHRIATESMRHPPCATGQA
jgi:choline dehydrogenase-like flavoprotein